MATLNVTPPVAAAPVVLPDSLVATNVWYPFFANMATAINGANTIINGIPGVNVFTLAGQPTLTAGDAGYLGYVSDYGHLVRWTGTAWEFFGGSENGYRRDFQRTPQGVGWGVMDGSTYAVLVMGGATLTTVNVATLNLTGAATFYKSTAAYSAAIDAAVAPALSGSTGSTAPGTDSQGTHNHTGATGSHVHTGTSNAPLLVDRINVQFGTDSSSVNGTHTHAFTTDGATASISNDGAHTHTVNSHLHAVGTLAADTAARPPSVGFVPYLRR